MKKDTFRDVMLRYAAGEVGVRETPRNSNRGKRVQQYQAATWLEGTGWPWCAAFICWLFKETLAHPVITSGCVTVPKGFKRPETAGAWDFENWATKMAGKGVERFEATDRAIEAGDILVYTFSHIGLASGPISRRKVPTIEGNTDGSGTREGGGVYPQSRKLSEIREVIRITF